MKIRSRAVRCLKFMRAEVVRIRRAAEVAEIHLSECC
jgi:hypothetical protein